MFPKVSFAKKVLEISCLNMSVTLGQKSKTLKFRYEHAINLFSYFDENKNIFISVNEDKFEDKEEIFVVRFKDHELGFQSVTFKGDTKPTMTMSKYDYKNNKFLDHYTCTAVITNFN